MDRVKFKNLFRFQKKSNLKASENEENGKYLFYSSSSIVSKRTDKPIYFEESIVFGNGGSANIHYADSPFSATSHCYIATPKIEEINIKYVYFYLNTNLYILERGFKGAGLKNISSKYIDEIDIPLPNLETQDKIVAILDKAKNLIKKREETIEMLEELLRATFLEMFGDSMMNPKGWNKNSLELLCSKIIDCPHETPEYLDKKSNYYCVRSSDIQRNNIDLEETKTVSEETYLRRISRHKPKKGEVIYTREGGRLGNAARVPENYNICLGQRMMLFIANENVAKNEFIWALLNSDSIKNQVINLSGGGAAPRINIRQLKVLEVIHPTIELQNLFASRVNQIDQIKYKFKQSLNEISNLLNSLSQKAFEGNLDFNTAVDLEVLLENDYEYFKDNSNKKAIQLLVDRLDKNELNLNKFYDQDMYDKAKSFVFELLKEGYIKQVLDKKTNTVKLTMQ